MTYSIDETNVIYADLDPKEGVVLNLKTKNYYRLNETGQFIWQSLAIEKSPDEIAMKLAEAYDVSTEIAKQDVEEMILKLREERLLEEPPSSLPSFDVEAARKSKKGR